MSRPTRVLILLAFDVPVAAYVAGSLSGSPDPPPTDRGPVILVGYVAGEVPTYTLVALLSLGLITRSRPASPPNGETPTSPR